MGDPLSANPNNLNNYFDFHVCPSFRLVRACVRPSVRPSVRTYIHTYTLEPRARFARAQVLAVAKPASCISSDGSRYHPTTTTSWEHMRNIGHRRGKSTRRSKLFEDVGQRNSIAKLSA